MTEKTLLLWVDLKSSNSGGGVQPLFEKYFIVQVLDSTASASLASQNNEAAAICFDFDYPDLNGLDLLRSIRLKHPHLPVIMMTEQHSESLAIWALRMRVWDFIVKPMDATSAEQEIRQLEEQIHDHGHWEEVLVNGTQAPQIPEEARFYNGSQEERALTPAISYIQQHFTEKITEEQMACLCRMRPFQFSRNFKKHCGVTFQEFVQRTRIEEAMRMLQNPNMTILDVALNVGFRDQSYFTRVFKKHIGIAPKAYRDNRNMSREGNETLQENLELFGAVNER